MRIQIKIDESTIHMKCTLTRITLYIKSMKNYHSAIIYTFFCIYSSILLRLRGLYKIPKSKDCVSLYHSGDISWKCLHKQRVSFLVVKRFAILNLRNKKVFTRTFRTHFGLNVPVVIPCGVITLFRDKHSWKREVWVRGQGPVSLRNTH